MNGKQQRDSLWLLTAAHLGLTCGKQGPLATIERIAGFCSSETCKQALILRIHGMAWGKKIDHLQIRKIMCPSGADKNGVGRV